MKTILIASLCAVLFGCGEQSVEKQSTAPAVVATASSGPNPATVTYYLPIPNSNCYDVIEEVRYYTYLPNGTLLCYTVLSSEAVDIICPLYGPPPVVDSIGGVPCE